MPMGVPKVIADLRTRRSSGGVDPDRPVIGILAFEAGAAMSRLVCLHRSITDDEIRRLRADMRSQGVTYLTSKDQTFLLRLACAEIVAELDKAAAAVARLGPKCRDPLLRGFDRLYEDLKAGAGGFGRSADLDRLGLGATPKAVEKRVKKMERLVEATSQLYAEMEILSVLEASERRAELQWRRHSGPIPIQKPCVAAGPDPVQPELRLQRSRVRRLKEESLWNKTFDKSVELMVRAVVTVFARICAVFGPYFLGYHGRQSSGPLERPAAQDSHFFRNSAPILTSKGGRETPFACLTKLLKEAPSTVGASGLALRYANVILLAERLLKCRGSGVEDDEGVEEEDEAAAMREELYQMIPAGMRGAVRAKLREWWKREGETTADVSLAEGWREAVAAILAWLGPVARDTVRWQEERNMERQQRFYTRPRALLLQTLHFADVDKAEAAIVEVLVGLSCMLSVLLHVMEVVFDELMEETVKDDT